MGTTHKVVYFGEGPDPSSLVTASKLLSPSALEISAAVKFEEWSKVVRSNPSARLRGAAGAVSGSPISTSRSP
jgi:hypothetical protein